MMVFGMADNLQKYSDLYTGSPGRKLQIIALVFTPKIRKITIKFFLYFTFLN
ncbi:MAG: hypothetical protein JWQ14_1858 [Adhaeribacter sp.]|nr:hypothetical protein [Adhaeribacter sp.]